MSGILHRLGQDLAAMPPWGMVLLIMAGTVLVMIVMAFAEPPRVDPPRGRPTPETSDHG